MSITHSRTSVRRRLAALAVMVLAVATLVAHRATAAPSGLTFSHATPTDGTTLFVARTAADDPTDPPSFQLKADIWFDNFSGDDAEVTDVTFRYPGSGIPADSNTPKRFVDTDVDEDDDPDAVVNWTLAPGADQRVAIHHGLDSDLPTPLPATVEIDFEFNGGGDPLTVAFDLAFYENSVPSGAYFFPARSEDLGAGEYWAFATRHVIDSGGGLNGLINPSTRSQRYALDMGVAAWDGSGWNGLSEGDGSQNDDYRVWEQPLYAMGDGVVEWCYRGEPDESPKGFDDVTFNFGFGNSLAIRYGTDLVSIGHMRDGSIPDELCPAEPGDDPGYWPSDDPLTGLSIPVEAGQQLGLVGNTGRSTAPHIHFQVEGDSSVSGAPMQFLNVRTLGDDDDRTNLGEDPTLQPMHGMTLHRWNLVLPNPCGFDLPPAGAAEVSRHGIPADCYQDVVNMMVARGYAPKFVDGFDVAGDTFFNATFHPADVAWQARHGLTGAQYQDLFDDLTGDGYRLHQVDSYLQDGQVRHAAIFEVRPGPNYAAFHGLDDDAYGDRVDELSDAGFVPVNISTVEVGGDLYWTGLFEDVDVTGWTIESVPVAAYQDTFDTNTAAGRDLVHVHGFNTGAGPYLTGVFVDPMPDNWAAVHGRTGGEYQDDWDATTATGLFTRHTTGYDNWAGSARYAALWRGRSDTTITSSPNDPTNTTDASFGFASDNPFATFECRLDGAPFATCDSPDQLVGLSEGFHTFEVRAMDRFRVADGSPATFTWLVDVTPPEITITEPAVDTKTVHGVPKDDPVDMTTVIGWADVVAEVTDNMSGVASVVFEVDGSPVPGTDVTQTGDDWSFEFSPHLNGEHVYAIEVIATDLADNVATESIDVLGVKTGKPNN